jgi:molecular chaperone DnaK
MDKKDIKEIKSIKTVPNTIGLAAPDGSFVPLITKDSILPATKTQTFTTSVDNQSSVFIHLFEGESKIAKENKSLGRFVLNGLTPNQKAGEPKIEVKFVLDINGVLSVTAKDKATGKESNIKITQQETKKE